MRNGLAVVTLALGIGACTVIFSFFHPLLLSPFTYPRPNELVIITERDPSGNESLSFSEFRDWSTQTSSFSGMAAFDIGWFNLTGVEEPEEIPGALITPNLFRVLGVEPALGRNFRDGEEGSVILTDATWKRRFNGDPNILGRTISLDFSRTPQVEQYTVIGVMPPNFWMYYGNFQVFVPLEHSMIRSDLRTRLMFAIGRLRSGVSVEQAQTSLNVIPIEKQWGVHLQPWQKTASEPARAQLMVLAGAAGLLLLIASANVAGLLLVRAHGRRREIAIRAALGASPARLAGLFLGESLRLGIAAAALGMLLAWWGVRTLVALLPPDVEMTRFLPGMDRVAVDTDALIFAAVSAMLACTLAALFPAWQVRTVDLINGLKDAGTIQSQRARRFLVTAEVALSVVLLSGAGLLIKTMERIRAIDLGFRPEKLLILRVPSPNNRPNQFDYQGLSERVAALPGVRSVALCNSIPDRVVEGFEIPGRSEKFSAGYKIVQPSYFTTLQIPLRRGRYFDDRDQRRVVISETMARRYWPTDDPVGRSIRFNGESLEIIGVIADTRPWIFRDSPPLVYRPLRDGRAGQLAVRTTGDPLALARAVTGVVRDLGGVVAEVGTMEHLVENTTWRHKQTAMLLSVFAALAFALATVGLYGVISLAVGQRTTEIGIRVAIGAKPRDVARLVLRQGIGPVLSGLVLGLGAALAATRMLVSLLYQVTPADPFVLVGVAIAIGVAAVAACLVPARRALRVDPLVALRCE